jgi:hypothetical protein
VTLAEELAAPKSNYSKGWVLPSQSRKVCAVTASLYRASIACKRNRAEIKFENL